MDRRIEHVDGWFRVGRLWVDSVTSHSTAGQDRPDGNSSILFFVASVYLSVHLSV